MSYIRALSNPEGLYAYTDAETKDMVRIHYGGFDGGDRFCNFPAWPGMLVPRRTFEAACARWVERRPERLSLRGLSIREVRVFEDGRRVPKGHKGLGKKRVLHLVEVRYRRKWMLLWTVTWHYVATNAAKRIDHGAPPRHGRKK